MEKQISQHPVYTRFNHERCHHCSVNKACFNHERCHYQGISGIISQHLKCLQLEEKGIQCLANDLAILDVLKTALLQVCIYLSIYYNLILVAPNGYRDDLENYVSRLPGCNHRRSGFLVLRRNLLALLVRLTLYWV